MKVRWMGKTEFLMLTHGKVYEVIAVEREWYRIVDDSGEDYLYPPKDFEEVGEDAKDITYESVCEKMGFPIEDMAKHFRIPKDITEDQEFSTPFDNLTHEEMEYVCAYLRKRNIVVTEEICAEYQNH